MMVVNVLKYLQSLLVYLKWSSLVPTLRVRPRTKIRVNLVSCTHWSGLPSLFLTNTLLTPLSLIIRNGEHLEREHGETNETKCPQTYNKFMNLEKWVKGVNFVRQDNINREKVICYQLEFGNNFADVSTECSSRHQGESERSAKQHCYL